MTNKKIIKRAIGVILISLFPPIISKIVLWHLPFFKGCMPGFYFDLFIIGIILVFIAYIWIIELFTWLFD